MVVKTRAKDGRRISAWAKSASFKAIARKALADWNSQRHTKPKCGAHGRTTGEPCKRIAMANGRCHAHGGRTPKGANWHKPVWPDAERPDAIDRLNRKLRDHRKTAKKRAARLAAMSPAERERHEAWQRSHRPGSKSARAAARQQRVVAQEIATTLAAPKSVDPEVARLQHEIDRLTELAAAGANEHDIFG
jgi:hypothetical protein